MGFFDAPGLAGVAGETVIDKDGKAITLQAGDVITISDSFRTYGRADGTVIGIAEWSFEATITVGSTLAETKFTATAPRFLTRTSGDPGFDSMVGDLNRLLQ